MYNNNNNNNAAIILVDVKTEKYVIYNFCSLRLARADKTIPVALSRQNLLSWQVKAQKTLC